MTKILPIIDRNHPVLRFKAQSVPLGSIATAETQALIDNMRFTLASTPDGVGLAAPQVSVSLRIFIVQFEEYEGVFVNPEVLSIDEKEISGEEGCLSVRGVYGGIKRAKSIKVKAFNRNGKAFKLRAKGFLARILQHELDHLEGKLFIDRAENIYSTPEET